MMSASDDDALMTELGEGLRGAKEVPASWRTAAQGAFAWRGVERDLLMLAQEGELAGAAVRGAANQRVLSFAGGEVSLEIEIGDRRIVGQVLPAGQCQVSIETPDGATVSTAADSSGLFTIDWSGRGPVRLGVERDGTTRRTEWVLL